jgi:hypothetical protein
MNEKFQYSCLSTLGYKILLRNVFREDGSGVQIATQLLSMTAMYRVSGYLLILYCLHYTLGLSATSMFPPDLHRSPPSVG